MTPYVTHRSFRTWQILTLLLEAGLIVLVCFLLWAYEDLNRRYQQPHITNMTFNGQFPDVRTFSDGYVLTMRSERPPTIEERKEQKKK